MQNTLDTEHITLGTIDHGIQQIAVEYEKAIDDLKKKQEKLIKVTDKYRTKEFNIKYVDDIDFKGIYGKANDDVRKYHVRTTLTDLRLEKQNLEIEVEYLKNRISFLKAVLYVKMEGKQ